MIDKDRIIFFNTAWMKEYQGNWETDIPHNGGQWIKENGWGGEVYNFQPLEGMMYGYVEPGLVEKGGRQRHLNISRLYTKRPSGPDYERISGVLVVWVATPNHGKSPEVVGWYENATVFHEAQIPSDTSVRRLPDHKNPGEYFAVAEEEDCVLIPSQNRAFHLPPKGEAFGHSNIWYAENSNGRSIKERVIKFIQDFKSNQENSTRYFVLGSKYRDDDNPNKWHGMWPQMRDKHVVSVGWANKLNLQKYYGKSVDEITKYLESKNEKSSISTLTKFLNLKPGDIIAIKDNGSPKDDAPYLSIRAYAVISEREGVVYGHDPSPGGLGHMLNADVIEEGLIELHLGGYGRTIQQVTNPDHIKKIFGYYNFSTNQLITGNSTSKRNTGSQYRSGYAGGIVDNAHNKLQQKVFDYLRTIHGDSVEMEKNHIDMVITEKNKTSICEVKAYNSVKQCIREALGQIIEYSWFKGSGHRQLSLVIIGPRKATEKEVDYLKYVKRTLNKSIEYWDFEENKIRVN